MSAGPYQSRAGAKLAHGLQAFGIVPAGWICADLGSHVGGFVDCLLQAGAARVHSVDTAYGTLAWVLRKDPRVVVHERTNALHVTLPEPVALVTIDVGWTPQRRIVPAARRLLATGGQIVTLIKPHYEAGERLRHRGVLAPEHYDAVVLQVLDDIRATGVTVVADTISPVTGHGGNREHLALLRDAC